MISFAVITHNQEKTIENCLKSIFSLGLKSFEILLIDDNSKDKTCEIASKYTNKIFYKTENERGISNSRNLAIENAKGNLLFIVDGDIELKQLDIVEVENIFKNNKKIIGICGKYSTSNNIYNLNHLLDLRRKLIFQKNEFPYEINLENYTTFSGGFSCLDMSKVLDLSRFINKVDFAAEDLIWQVEQLNSGFSFYYLPTYIGFHNHFRDIKTWSTKILSEIKGNYWLIWYFTNQDIKLPVLEQVTAFPLFLVLSIILIKFSIVLALLTLIIEFVPILYPLIYKKWRNKDTLFLVLYSALNKILTLIYFPISIFVYRPNLKHLMIFLYNFIYSGIVSKFKSVKGFNTYVN